MGGETDGKGRQERETSKTPVPSHRANSSRVPGHPFHHLYCNVKSSMTNYCKIIMDSETLTTQNSTLGTEIPRILDILLPGPIRGYNVLNIILNSIVKVRISNGNQTSCIRSEELTG